MPEPAADPLISVRAGVAEPATMALPPGQAIGPLSFGRLGTWRVIAPGVLEEHGFLYFNGSALFLQSADPNTPVTVNGAAIPIDWTPVYAPCEVAFGGARLWFGPPAAPVKKPAASVAPPRPESSTASRSFSPRVKGLDEDDESTRMHPIEEMTASRKPLLKDPTSATLKSAMTAPPGAFDFNTPPPGALSFGAPPAAPSAPVMGPGPLFGPPMPFPAPPSLPAPLDIAPPAPPNALTWLRARWREASGPKKAMVFLMLPLIWAVWVIFTDKPPAARPAKAAPSATAPAASATPSGAPSVASATPVAPPPVAPPPEPAATASAKGSASAPAAPQSTAKTPQREAADAVAAGAFDRAARLYDDLARAHPEVPAYAEAARIMKARAGKR